MEAMRKPFQGVLNIIRFNRHLYLLALALIVFLIAVSKYSNGTIHIISLTSVLLILISIVVSLGVSSYIYDFSELYSLKWISTDEKERMIVNIHAGFDETSYLLQSKFRKAELKVFDFYNPLLHTEISIRRARKAYPPFPQTTHINTSDTKLVDDGADKIFVILAAHEIRVEEERVSFFNELGKKLNERGQIYVTEHLRDAPNFLVYNIGFFHFYSVKTWRRTFRNANLKIIREKKITPFITTFILCKNGNSL